jgi:hypothetical protein
MAQATPVKEKTNDNEATRMIKAANDLEKVMPVRMDGDLNLIDSIAQQITSNTARSAKNIAESIKLDSEIELRQKQDKLRDMENPQPRSQAGMMGGMQVGLGGGGRAAIVQSILASIPEADRAEFVSKNKEMLLGPETSAAGLLGLYGKQAVPQAQGGSMMELATIITALGEERRQDKLVEQRLNPQYQQQQLQLQMQQQGLLPQTPQAQQSQGGVSQMELINLMRDMNATNMTLMRELSGSFTSTIKQVQDQFQTQSDKHREETMQMRKELLDAQQASFEKDRQYFQDQIDRANSSAPTPANVLTLNHIPMLREQLAGIGMKVGTENALQEGERRKWDIEDKKIDLEEQRLQRENDRILRREELEAEKARSRTTALAGFAGLLGQAIQSKRVGKAMDMGTPNASSVAVGRFE